MKPVTRMKKRPGKRKVKWGIKYKGEAGRQESKERGRPKSTPKRRATKGAFRFLKKGKDGRVQKQAKGRFNSSIVRKKGGVARKARGKRVGYDDPAPKPKHGRKDECRNGTGKKNYQIRWTRA